jgi:hypothetical protein
MVTVLNTSAISAARTSVVKLFLYRLNPSSIHLTIFIYFLHNQAPPGNQKRPNLSPLFASLFSKISQVQFKLLLFYLLTPLIRIVGFN